MVISPENTSSLSRSLGIVSQALSPMDTKRGDDVGEKKGSSDSAYKVSISEEGQKLSETEFKQGQKTEESRFLKEQERAESYFRQKQTREEAAFHREQQQELNAFQRENALNAYDGFG